jgi:hypothetical protein
MCSSCLQHAVAQFSKHQSKLHQLIVGSILLMEGRPRLPKQGCWEKTGVHIYVPLA